METPHKKLYRSKVHRIVAGVCGGIAEYLNMDPVIFRLLCVLVVVFSGIFPGVILYIIAIFIIPEERLSQ
ncbi:MAG: PspC domain-containing protein [bacterium]|nr:PspC domain-containing protein [bacterium]